MKMLPASLATRTVLLVIAIIAIAEVASFSLVFHHGRVTHTNRTVQYVAGQIRLLQTVLPGLDASARQRLSSTDVGEQWLQLRPDGASVPEHEPKFGFARRLGRDLGLLLGETVSLRHAGPGLRSALWIGFMAGNERWWLVLPPPRFEPQALPPDLWWWLAGTLVLLIVIAGFFVRGIVRPLARLGEAVAATGGGSARTVTPEGPKEVQRLAERHNTMVEQLASADAERREMLAGLTHDLRAPLARLRVRLALLESDAERAGLARDAEDMERIVTQCLDFLHSEGIGSRPVAPLFFADAVSSEVARHCEVGSSVAMSVGERVADAQVAISPGDLQRLMDNLIDNAFRHGKPPVNVTLFAAQDGFVQLEIRDHGAGVAAEQRTRALEAFAQIDPARATDGSCGLGLAIVRRIVNGCGGELTLEEAEGGGLSVAMRFPVRRV
ncbi:MAG: HAMP domain-containing sensor histidine kinase [Betaproteobacteria bacterium]